MGCIQGSKSSSSLQHERIPTSATPQLEDISTPQFNHNPLSGDQAYLMEPKPMHLSYDGSPHNVLARATPKNSYASSIQPTPETYSGHHTTETLHNPRNAQQPITYAPNGQIIEQQRKSQDSAVMEQNYLHLMSRKESIETVDYLQHHFMMTGTLPASVAGKDFAQSEISDPLPRIEDLDETETIKHDYL